MPLDSHSQDEHTIFYRVDIDIQSQHLAPWRMHISFERRLVKKTHLRDISLECMCHAQYAQHTRSYAVMIHTLAR